eukprot:SAG11_NODE_11344_length_767_cov_0.904192_1_plen_82_part_00
MEEVDWLEAKLVGLKSLFDKGLLQPAVYEAKQQELLDLAINLADLHQPPRPAAEPVASPRGGGGVPAAAGALERRCAAVEC